MELTIELPDSLRDKINDAGDSLPKILECGFKYWSGDDNQGYAGEADLLEIFANFPTPEDVIDLRPSEILQQRVSELLEKSKQPGGLTNTEELEWQRYERLEQMVRKAKAKARLMLAANPDK
ncbi:MAG: hypothetical protein P1V20_14400 [Verrucomicrobiales bacterium]|nr:hypothetical protein [Verrucomicrobiales bacterium]